MSNETHPGGNGAARSRSNGYSGPGYIGKNGHSRVVPRTLVDAIESCYLVDDNRGFTFLQNDGSERHLRFRDLVVAVRQRGRQLVGLGLHKGDRLALVIPDADEFVLTFLGAVSVGVIPVPLYPPLSLGRLDAYLDATVRILNTAQADLLVTTAQVQKILWTVMPRVPSLRDLITCDKLAKARESTAELPQISPHDPLFLQFTSGSTAAPKGVMVTHASLCANAVAIMRDGLATDPLTDKGVSWLPFYHDMGLIGFVLAPLVAEVPVVFIPTLAFVKRPTLWMDVVDKHRGTITFAPNFAFARLTKRASDADLKRWDLSCLKVVGCGAEPIHAGTMRAFLEKFTSGARLRPEAILPSYGMAEATLAMSFAGLSSGLRTDAIDPDACYEHGRAVQAGPGVAGPLELVGCGRTFPDHELAIFGCSGHDDGDRLPERQIGEICFRGPSVAAGYYHNQEATRAIFGDDESGRWLHTGDLGYLADGDLFISGRKKDILIIHGRNYYPQGIEWLAEEVPGIRKANVVAFSVPGAASEEVIIVAESTEVDAQRRKEIAEQVKRHVHEEMALAVGDVVLLAVGELPKTTSGKLQRRKAREQYLAGNLGKEGVRLMDKGGERLQIARHLMLSFVSRVRHQAGSLLGLRRGKSSAETE